nr:hypothetical protein [Tanacetum cinerariifolium]
LKEAEAIRLRAEASKFEAVERSIQGEVETLKEHNIIIEKDKNELGVKVVDLAASVKVREQEVADLDVVVTFIKSQNDNLVKQVHELEVSSAVLREKVSTYENCNAKYNIRERRRLQSVVEEKDILLKAIGEEIKNLKARSLLKEAEAIRLRAEASKFEAVERSIQGEVETLKEHNIIIEKDKNELGVKVVDLAASVKVREQEVADLDVVVTFIKSQNDNLVKQVHELEVSSAVLREKVSTYENCMEQLEEFQDEQMKL